jgi:hypothetical protein
MNRHARLAYHKNHVKTTASIGNEPTVALFSMGQVLRRLYELTFLQGFETPLFDVLRQLLEVSCPKIGGPKVARTSGRC